MMLRMILCGAVMLLATACAEADASDASSPPTQSASATAGQRGDGRPYEVVGSQVWDVPDPVSGRRYQVFVALPPSYDTEPGRTYPVLYVTDADYAFPIIRQIARRVNLEGPVIEEFILVGLSYAAGDDGRTSRNRDYTPTPDGPRSASDTLHGGGPAYQTYLRDQALPFIEGRYRADPAKRILLGHSYGGLLGAQVLFTQPDLFSAYVLGSPSLWFGDHAMLKAEAAYAAAHTDLPAHVHLYVGAYETRGSTTRHNRNADMVGDNARFEARLRERNYPGLRLSSEVLPDEDHLTVAPRGFTNALMAVLPARR
jgi:uncharacterized protein